MKKFLTAVTVSLIIFALSLISLSPAKAQGNPVVLSSLSHSGTIPTSPGTGTVNLGAIGTDPNTLAGAYGTITFTITGGWSGTITPEVQSCDGLGTWTAVQVFPFNSTTGQSTITGNGVFTGSAIGFCAVRARGSSVATAAAAVTITVTSIGGGSGGGGGGGGGAVTIANGADVALGSTTDSACGTSTGTCSLIALIKYLNSIGIPVSGTTSNASSGVATSSTNIPSVSYNYAFNGTTWDQLQDDASKNLKVGPQYSGDIIINPSANFTRLNNTTAYASGQLVANSATAGSVVPLSWTAARIATGNFRITRVRMSLSGKSVTNTNFRIHFFNASPGFANGDGGTFTPSVLADEVCEMDVTIGLAGSDVSMGYGASNQGVACDVALASGSTLYGAVEARAAYTPVAQEVVTVIPEIHEN
jgi:hypothetical protein